MTKQKNLGVIGTLDGKTVIALEVVYRKRQLTTNISRTLTDLIIKVGDSDPISLISLEHMRNTTGIDYEAARAIIENHAQNLQNQPKDNSSDQQIVT